MARDVEKLAAQAERLKELRRMARVSQLAAANAIGVTPRAYQDWEAGRGGFSGENLKKAAAYFGTSPDYIEYGIVDPKRPRTPDLSNGPPGGWNELLDRLSSIEDQLQALGGAVAELVAAEAERARREVAQRRRRPPGGNQ